MSPLLMSAKSIFSILGILLLCGCAHKPQHVATVQLVYTRECIKLADDSQCVAPDVRHPTQNLHCKLDLIPDCGQLQITKADNK